jgi:hypothetical protein
MVHLENFHLSLAKLEDGAFTKNNRPAPHERLFSDAPSAKPEAS